VGPGETRVHFERDVRTAGGAAGGRRGIRAVGLRVVMFEEFGGRDADPEEAYLAEVEGSDIYIGILGRRYGKPLKSRYSATHAEYLHAEKHALRMAIWTLAAPDREGHEQTFLDEVRTFYVAPEFRTVTDLQRQVEERLRAIAAEDLAPWCKLGNVVFRAMEVEDRGSNIQVTARVKDDTVALALEEIAEIVTTAERTRRSRGPAAVSM
jgi:hypothetical protein